MIEPLFRLKAINQIGFVVEDIDKAMEAYWKYFGIGPWKVYNFGSPVVKDTKFRGKPEDFHMTIAIAKVGELDFELIEHKDGDTIYKEFMARNPMGGVHHLAWFVKNIDEAVREMEQLGFKVIQSGRGYGKDGDGGFAYLSTEDELGALFELLEVPSERIPPHRVYPAKE